MKLKREMNEKGFKWWSRTRKIGKIKYILIMSVIYGFLGNLLIHLAKLILNILDPQKVKVDTPILTFICWSIGGIVVGTVAWNINEKYYNNYIKQLDNSKKA